MKINIKPFQQFVPAQGSLPAGMVTVSQIELLVQSLALNEGAVFSYQLQSVDNTDPKSPRTRNVASGSYALTPAQFAEWGTNDEAVAAASLANIGLGAA
jgi:hypothetical protein